MASNSPPCCMLDQPNCRLWSFNNWTTAQDLLYASFYECCLDCDNLDTIYVTWNWLGVGRAVVKGTVLGHPFHPVFGCEQADFPCVPVLTLGWNDSQTRSCLLPESFDLSISDWCCTKVVLIITGLALALLSAAGTWNAQSHKADCLAVSQ